MKTVGDFFRKLGHYKWLIGVAFMLVGWSLTTAFSLGATSVKVKDIPERLTLVEGGLSELRESHDNLSIKIGWQDWKLEKIDCMVDAIFKGTEIGPTDCDPDPENIPHDQD